MSQQDEGEGSHAVDRSLACVQQPPRPFRSAGHQWALVSACEHRAFRPLWPNLAKAVLLDLRTIEPHDFAAAGVRSRPRFSPLPGGRGHAR